MEDNESMRSATLLDRTSQSRTSGSSRFPPSTKSKAVLAFHRSTGEYAVERDFSLQLDSEDPKDSEKRQVVKEFVDTLNSRKNIFPCNQSIGPHLWILAWLASSLVIGLILWILLVVVTVFLMNIIVLAGSAWLFWFILTRIPFFIAAALAAYKIRLFKKFVKEYNKGLTKGREIRESSDGLYLEVHFDKDDSDESAIRIAGEPFNQIEETKE